MTTTPPAPEPRPERVQLGDLCGTVDDSDQPMCMSCDLATDRLRGGLPNLEHARCVATWVADASPAEILRAAASRVRQLAADATDGPWVSEDPNNRWGDDHDHRLVGGGKILATFDSEYNGPLNADYAAVMHPGVGRTLADLLDDLAAGDDHGVVNPLALTAARAVLGVPAPQSGPVAATAPRSAPGGVSDPASPERAAHGRTTAPGRCDGCGHIEHPPRQCPLTEYGQRCACDEPIPERASHSPRAEPKIPKGEL